MCAMVWILLGYSCLTITLLAQTGGIPPYLSFIYTILVTLALSCHIKTTLTDPGSVPASAVPTEIQRTTHEKLAMCSQCQTFKPPQSHHCRICNRCVSKMDRKFIARILKWFCYRLSLRSDTDSIYNPRLYNCFQTTVHGWTTVWVQETSSTSSCSWSTHGHVVFIV